VRRDHMNRPCILVVEDNEIQRKVIKLLSLEYGFESVFAVNCQEALAAFMASADLYDLVLMDLRLPDGNGEECAAQLRRIRGAKRVPIVAMTGYIDSDNKQHCTDMGLDDCLIKPFSAREFRDMVNHWTKADYNVLPFRDGTGICQDGQGSN
jgi:CheY-like chemotaxis protein